MNALVKSHSKPGLWLDDVPMPEVGITDDTKEALDRCFTRREECVALSKTKEWVVAMAASTLSQQNVRVAEDHWLRWVCPFNGRHTKMLI
ncbi:MAG: hypothetical protein ACP5QA_03240 [Phycisphaerae bacterium]